MPEPDYNTSAVSSAPTSSPSPQSRPSGLGSRSGRNMDADMYAGSSYAPTSNAGTASATQTPSPKATSTGSFTGAASNKSDDGPGYGQPYNPAATLYSNTATALTNAGVNLTPPTQASYNPMNLYSSQSMAEISTEINDYLRNTAIDDAMREALGIPEVYQGIPTAEEPEPNIDMSVLQGALQPEPITVEELPEDRMFVGMDGSDMFEEDVTVKAGDTLTAIAEANNLPVQDVIDANPQIANPDMIRPGEKVKLTKRLDTKGETPERELPKVLSIPEAAAYLGKERATLIMKGIDKLFGLVPPKTDVEKQAKSELEYFLDAQPESSLPDFFKYVPDKVQLAEYMKGRAERKKAAGTMNFSDRSALTNMDNLQLVDIEGATGSDPTQALLDRIALGEGADPKKLKAQEKYGIGSTPYDMVYAYGSALAPDKPVTEMTMKELESYQRKLIAATKGKVKGTKLGTSAVGKYQVIKTSLFGAGGTAANPKKNSWADKLDLKEDTIYTPEVQEKIGFLALKEAGYNSYIKGDRTQDSFQNKIANIWASVAKSDGTDKYGQGIHTVKKDLEPMFNSLAPITTEDTAVTTSPRPVGRP